MKNTSGSQGSPTFPAALGPVPSAFASSWLAPSSRWGLLRFRVSSDIHLFSGGMNKPRSRGSHMPEAVFGRDRVLIGGIKWINLSVGQKLNNLSPDSKIEALNVHFISKQKVAASLHACRVAREPIK